MFHRNALIGIVKAVRPSTAAADWESIPEKCALCGHVGTDVKLNDDGPPEERETFFRCVDVRSCDERCNDQVAAEMAADAWAMRREGIEADGTPF